MTTTLASRVEGRLTPAYYKALKWFSVNSPVALFGKDAPSRQIRRKLEADGHVIIYGRETGRGAFGLTMFTISESGLALLRAVEEREG